MEAALGHSDDPNAVAAHTRALPQCSVPFVHNGCGAPAGMAGAAYAVSVADMRRSTSGDVGLVDAESASAMAGVAS